MASFSATSRIWSIKPRLLVILPEGLLSLQLNYDNFISTMAEMIQKYAPQIQKLRERQ